MPLLCGQKQKKSCRAPALPPRPCRLGLGGGWMVRRGRTSPAVGKHPATLGSIPPCLRTVVGEVVCAHCTCTPLPPVTSKGPRLSPSVRESKSSRLSTGIRSPRSSPSARAHNSSTVRRAFRSFLARLPNCPNFVFVRADHRSPGVFILFRCSCREERKTRVASPMLRVSNTRKTQTREALPSPHTPPHVEVMQMGRAVSACFLSAGVPYPCPLQNPNQPSPPKNRKRERRSRVPPPRGDHTRKTQQETRPNNKDRQNPHNTTHTHATNQSKREQTTTTNPKASPPLPPLSSIQSARVQPSTRPPVAPHLWYGCGAPALRLQRPGLLPQGGARQAVLAPLPLESARFLDRKSTYLSFLVSCAVWEGVVSVCASLCRASAAAAWPALSPRG
eukprot:TRINITY_DN1339_c0_g3_i1.p1 TRINITY_DN1339_c0_g3~~TRINITY_DN1339_c0_g3_i1.p1  ORF type:complete len:390 (+),score=-88.70 TRINITY_DN1339_c0_g3_i1:466-1635(+)